MDYGLRKQVTIYCLTFRSLISYILDDIRICCTYKNNFEVDNFYNDCCIENLWIHLIIAYCSFCIEVMYRSPKQNVREAKRILEYTLSSFLISYEYVCGDINVNLPNPNNSSNDRFNGCRLMQVLVNQHI